MLDPEIGLAGPHPEKAAHKPTAGVARIERERTIDQADHRTNILAEPRQHLGGIGEDSRVVLRLLECLPGKIAGLPMGYCRLFGPTLNDKPQVAVRGQRGRRSVMPIDCDRLLEQSLRLDDPLFGYWKEC